ncbi:MAG: hypothetical protein RIQ29_549, partial [Pseudomonadota bacterium]
MVPVTQHLPVGLHREIALAAGKV